MAYNPYNNQNTGTIVLQSPLTDDYALIVQSFRAFKSNFLQAKHIGAALKNTSKPAVKALRKATPKGPTGNLKRAVDVKVRRYDKQENGWAVCLVGFRAAGKMASQTAQGGRVRKGKDRGFHQGWIEFGTKNRQTRKKDIASSWNTLGPFSIGVKVGRKKDKTTGKYRKTIRKMSYRQTQKLYTIPKSPKAFFKRAPTGQKVQLGRVKIGGKKGKAPIKTAFKQALPEMQTKLPEEMKKSLEACRREAFARWAKKNYAYAYRPY